MKTAIKTAIILSTVWLTHGAGPAFAATCESLASLKLSDATITMAQPVAAGAFTPPAGGRGERGDRRRRGRRTCRSICAMRLKTG